MITTNAHLRETIKVGLTLSLAAVSFSCAPSIDEQCYRRDSALDWEGSPTSRPYCDWQQGELPMPPPEFARTNKVFVAFDATDEHPCDPCDVEGFDELLRAEIERQCPGEPYSDLTRGCYIPENESTNGQCWVEGIYFANFMVAAHSCVGCDPETGECKMAFDKGGME